MTAISRPAPAPVSLSAWLPWTDRAGRLSWLKLAVFCAVCAPAVWMLVQWQMGWLLAKPITDILRQTGDWAVRLLIAGLVLTPLRFVTKWNRVITVRRMVGLAALAYTGAHLLFYAWDEAFVWWTILREMVLRLYLVVGTASLLIMAVLGVTSNDASIHKLGAARWNNLHAWVYPCTALACLHYFMLVRLDASQPALWSGFLLLFFGFRVIRKSALGTGVVSVLALAVFAGVGSALIEALYYWLANHADPMLILSTNFDFSYTIRPAWFVLAGGLSLALLRGGRAVLETRLARA